jgi:two-component system, sensor histidine kinase LadS
MKLKHLLVFCFFTLTSNLFASDTLVLFNELGIKKIKNYMSFYCDSSGNKTIEDMLTTKFSKVNDELDYFTFSFQHQPFWFKINIKNAGVVPIQQYLEINRSYFPVVDLYELDADGDMVHVKSGSRIPFRERPVNFNTVAFNIKLNPTETKSYYLNIHTKGLTLVFRPQLYEHQKLFKSNWSLNLYYGTYFGVLLIVIINALFLYFVERRPEFLYYFLMVFSALVVNSFYSGYILRVIQDFPFVEAHYKIFGIGAFLATASGCLFTMHFLNLKEKLPKWNKTFIIISIISFLFIILILFVPFHFITRFSFYITALTSFLVSAVAFVLYRRGEKTARFFVIGYFMLCAGIILYGLRVYNLVPENNFTIHTFEFGTMLEMIFLFLALSDKQNLLKKKYEAVQRQKQASSEESNLALVNLVHEQTGILTQSEMQIAEQTVKVKELENKLSATNKFEAQKNLSKLLNHMIYENLKLRIDKVEEVLKSFSKSFSYFKSQSDIGNAFTFGATLNGTTYFIVGENDLDSQVAPTLNLLTRAYFYNSIVENFNISPNEILKRLNYYYKSQMQHDDLDEEIGIRLGIIKIRDAKFEFSSAGQSMFLVKNSEVEIFGDEQAVLGNSELPRDYNFINHTFALESMHSAYVYLVGWGLVHERGGFSNDVYSEERMSELLKNMHGMDPEDQKNRIGQIFSNWLLQAESVQKNDWFVLGFELN